MSTDVAVPGGTGIDGLDDVQSSDLTMPIFRLDHEKMKLVDGLTNQEFDSLSVIALGVVKARIMWPAEPGVAGEGPVCRAYDLDTGHPDPDKWTKVVLSASGFDRAAVEAGDLPCANCNLKEWGSHPKGDGPWCNEQWTTPILVLNEDGGFMPALISHQRTGIKPLRNYITGFVGRSKPLYTARTILSVIAAKKGTAEYATLKWQLAEESDPGEWANYSAHFASIRTFLTTPRKSRAEHDAEKSTETSANPANANTPPETPPPPPPAAPAPPPTPPTPGQTADVPTPPAATKRAEPSPEPAPAATATASADEEDEVPF